MNTRCLRLPASVLDLVFASTAPSSVMTTPGAMMFGHLNFEVPKMEAMGNMGPFEGFLRRVGKVPGEWGMCS